VRSSSDRSLNGISVLVVDGDHERRAHIVGIVRDCGALVTPAQSMDAALAVMALLTPDVVVVDFTRPDDLGLPLIRQVKSRAPDDGEAIAVIAVSESDANAELARTSGFDGYLAAPFEPSELCGLVATLWNR